MGVVLAIERDSAQADILRQVFRGRVAADLVIVTSKQAAITLIDRQLPDLILITALLTTRDEDALVAHLRTIPNAGHLQTLRIPQLRQGDEEAAAPARRGLFGFGKKKASSAPTGVDPLVFADEVSAYLVRANEARQDAQLRKESAPLMEDATALLEDTAPPTEKAPLPAFVADAPPAAAAGHADPWDPYPAVSEPAIAPGPPAAAIDPLEELLKHPAAPQESDPLASEVDRIIRSLGVSTPTFQIEDPDAVSPAPVVGDDDSILLTTEVDLTSVLDEPAVVAPAARRESESSARLAAEMERLRLETEARQAAELERVRVEEEARRAAELERVRQEEEARRAAELEQVRREEEARRAAEVERLRVEEEARRAAELERMRVEEEARRAAELERVRREEEARRAAELERVRLEEEARRAAELERLRAEEEARRAAELERVRLEEEARRAAEVDRVRKEAEAKRAAELAALQQEKEAQARLVAELERERKASEARRAAELQAMQEQAEAQAKLVAELERVRQETEARRVAELAALQEEAEALRQRAIEEARAAAETEAREALATELARVRKQAETEIARVQGEAESKIAQVQGEAKETFAEELMHVRAEAEKALASELARARADQEQARQQQIARALQDEVARVRADADARMQAELDRVRREAEQARQSDQAELDRIRQDADTRLAAEVATVRADAERRRATEVEKARAEDATARQAQIARALEEEMARVRTEAEARLQTELNRVRGEAERARQADQAELDRIRRDADERLGSELAALRADAERRRAAELDVIRNQVAAMREAAAQQARSAAAEAVAAEMARNNVAPNDPAAVAARAAVAAAPPQATQPHYAEKTPSGNYYELWRSDSPKSEAAPAPKGKKARRFAIPKLPFEVDKRRAMQIAAGLAVVVGGAVTAESGLIGAMANRMWSVAGTRKATVASAVPLETAASRDTGDLLVETTPPGARVLIDGKARGVSPVTLTDLKPGKHRLELETEAGTIRREVIIRAGERAVADEAIMPGWLTIYSRIPVDVSVGGKRLGSSEDGQLLLPPGRHKITLSNARFNYKDTASVNIDAGRVETHNVTLPLGRIDIDAPAGAEVWVEGQRIGEGPQHDVPVPIGTREVLLKHPSFGEIREFVEVRRGATSQLQSDAAPAAASDTTSAPPVPKLLPLSRQKVKIR